MTLDDAGADHTAPCERWGWYGYATASNAAGVLRGTGGIQSVGDGSLDLLSRR